MLGSGNWWCINSIRVTNKPHLKEFIRDPLRKKVSLFRMISWKSIMIYPISWESTNHLIDSMLWTENDNPISNIYPFYIFVVYS